MRRKLEHRRLGCGPYTCDCMCHDIDRKGGTPMRDRRRVAIGREERRG